jgi:hypothetical protein
MEQRMKEENINYYDHNEFIDIEKIGGVYKANWKQSGKLVALKSFKLDNDNIEEIAHEVCKNFLCMLCKNIMSYLKVPTKKKECALYSTKSDLRVSCDH